MSRRGRRRSSAATSAITVRTKADRTLRRIENSFIWDYAPQAARDDAHALEQVAEVIREGMAIALTAPSASARTDALRLVLEAHKVGHTIRKESFLDRTVPTLQSMDLRAVFAAFGFEAGAEEKRLSDKFSAEKREAIMRLFAMAHRASLGEGNGNGAAAANGHDAVVVEPVPPAPNGDAQ